MLELIKGKLKIDGNEEDIIIQLLIDGAKEALLGSGVPESEKALYKIAVITHVLLNYENQDKSLNVPGLKQSLETTILQLRDYNNGGNHESK
ncbi:head-tail connector protein [Bacillus cereus]|uniref:head-tail connector protein n=1 Tax=Bacillus cereus TaxID=1396 RepID=UPI001D071B7E|nr:head-tail connector protein [Bacillus cereus]MCB5900275.1 head-tail connector protein [Bacillus cereus]MCU4733431.1 head-tail connector protein [Bacillus cereus]MEC2945778.1 head-tail connector protein [Bacillus cereus]MEC3174048.1 head-tail connector protein [Bacillus cereus]